MRSLLLPLLPLCAALQRALPLSPPPSCSTPSHPSPTLSRRHLASSLLTASLASFSVSPASAFFESREQLAVSSVATAQPKVASMLAEVAEVARKRRKMSSDDEDDAYVYRFARGVIDPALEKVQEAAPLIAKALSASSSDASEQMAGLPGELKKQLSELDVACRMKDSDAQVDSLKAIDFLALASKAKQDVTSKDDINGYTGSAPILYNKFLFRAG
ncbi:MAG: hypothetical protein SGPRY_009161 [Prymnesium sp.]